MTQAGLYSPDRIEMMIRVPVVLLALTVHEFCHAYFALLMGDPTAYRLGRCSLNPLRHLDPVGTICLMFAPIGWAKPVPINPVNFRDWRQGVLVATAAGPLSNLVQAFLFSGLLRVLKYVEPSVFGTQSVQAIQFCFLMEMMFILAVRINVSLAVFNCIPLYPLDGFHISLQLMRSDWQQRFIQMAPAGPFIIMGMVLIGNYNPQFDILGTLLRPPVQFFLHRVAGY